MADWAGSVVVMSERLCLLTVHAHPDDESSKGAATVARYHAEGVHTVLVTCTGGEEGDILNPAMDLPHVRADIGAVRMKELDEATRIIGFDEVAMLGYRDSGMPDTPGNEHPESFNQAPLDEAIGRLVAIIRRVRPQVLICYPEDQRGYRHPDHLRVHEITVAAYDAAADPSAYPEAGEPYAPLKLYYSANSRASFLERHQKFLELGLESPYAERIAKGGFNDRPQEPEPEPSALIDLTGFGHVRRLALLAHATQIDPTSMGWFGLPDEVEFELHRYDAFILAKTRIPVEGVEDDLFNGVRESVSR
jgi:mycothiol S-conjugate amidase